MAWMAAHLFLECKSETSSDESRRQEAVEQLLLDRTHRVDLDVQTTAPPPLVICPPHAGWVVVTGAGAWIDDLPWAAERLSAACGGVALSCEVFGNCYRSRLGHFQGGAQQQLVCSPAETWAGEVRAMPLYEDVEQVIFEALSRLEIPPALIAVGTRPLGSSGEPVPLGPAVTLSRHGDTLTRGTLDVTLPALAVQNLSGPYRDAPGSDAPVLPTRVGQDFGLMLFEDRYLEGDPSGPALDRLLGIEAALTERARRATARTDLSTTFTYFAGPHQDKLDAMLRVRDRHTLPVEARERPPWWQFWRYLGRVR